MTTISGVPTVSARRRLVSVLAVAGTVPYLTLKVAWLSGSRVGLLDPDFGRSATMHLANAATLVMDAVAVLLAVAFVARWRLRVPSPLVLAPMWVGTGLLAPIVVILPLQIMIGVPESSASGPTAIADWVYLVVYAGFFWQGVFLMLGFALWARERWGEVAGRPLGSTHATATTRAAWVLLASTAVLLALGADDHGAIAWPNRGGDLAAVLAAGLGLGLLHLGTGPRWRAVVLTWLGSGALLTWGVYQLVLQTVPNDLVDASTVTTVDVTTQLVRVAAGLAALAAARQVGRALQH